MNRTRLPGVNAMSLVGFMTFLALYIMIVSGPSPVIVLDFDGTVTERDVGDEVCDRFAPPAWRDIDAAWVRNEISLPDAQRQMWALARAERHEALAYAHEIGHLRRGLDELLTTSARRGSEVWLASGGFDFYIEGILGERLSRFARVYCNRAHFSGGNIAVEFPHTAIACERCAVCKGNVCDLARVGAGPATSGRSSSSATARATAAPSAAPIGCSPCAARCWPTRARRAAPRTRRSTACSK